MTDLDRLEEDLADVEVALGCLAREGNDLCDVCRAARVEGSLDHRPALAACSANKLPAETKLQFA